MIESFSKPKKPSNLKLLSLNLHCFEEKNISEKQAIIVKEILSLDLDIILLQEVAQYINDDTFFGKIKESNYGLVLQRQLNKHKKNYHYYYEPIKQSFNKYDEGIGILSKYQIEDFKDIYISKTRDYSNWKLRKMIKGNLIIGDLNITLVNVHMGWTDEDEIFEEQVDLLVENCNLSAFTIFVGDFNVRPNSKEYDYLISKGLIDSFKDDREMFEKKTYALATDINKDKARIDYFFSSKKLNIIERDIIFTDMFVSDHYGVYIKIEL